MAIDAGTAAIIGICVALGVTLLCLIVFLIMYCRLRIEDDTNIRKRILSRQAGAYREDIKTNIVEEAAIPTPRPQVVPVPVPAPAVVPVAPPAPQAEPEVVIHEVVHRYDPPTPPPVAPPPVQGLVRRSSWTEGHVCHNHHNHGHHCQGHHGGDEWVMVKKGKRGLRRRHDSDSSSDSSSDDDDDYSGGRLAHYDLAMPHMMPAGAGMGAAAYMMGARPMMMAQPGVPMTTGAVFQPTYGIVPQM